MINKISFPEHEYESIQNYLKRLGYCYTTRVYKEVGKYKVGELYTAPWGDVLKIDEVKTYWKVSERPFYDEMSDDEKHIFIEKRNKNIETAKKLILAILPMLLTVLFNYIEMIDIYLLLNIYY